MVEELERTSSSGVSHVPHDEQVARHHVRLRKRRCMAYPPPNTVVVVVDDDSSFSPPLRSIFCPALDRCIATSAYAITPRGG